MGTSLEALQKAVAGGGLVEHICLPDNQIMVIDEEGLYKDYQINIAASLLAMRPIVGDAVIAHSKEID